MSNTHLIGKEHNAHLDWLLNTWMNGNSPVCFLEGFPGTGKSTIARELIAQAVTAKLTAVLITAPKTENDPTEDLLLDLAMELNSAGRNELAKAIENNRPLLDVLSKIVEGNTLAQEYSAQRYLNLEADAQETIKKLNRCLLEERYVEITPKHDTSKLEGFRWLVFCKSTRLYLLTFLELSHQEELNGKSWLFCISILEIIVAHVHLGIFISYLFQKLARR